MEPNKPLSQQFSEVAGALPETVYNASKLSLGGVAEAIGEHWGIKAADEWGEGLRKEAGAELDRLAIRNATFGQQVAMTAGQSLGQAIPLMFAAYATRSPHIVTSGFGMMEFGRAYGDARNKGIDQDKAVKYAAASGLVETATEYLPTKYLFGKSPSMLGRFARFFGSEIVGEETAEVSQRYLEWWGGLSEEPTGKELVEIMKLTAVATPIGATGQITLARAMDSLDRSYNEVMKDREKPDFSQQEMARRKLLLSAVLNNQIVGKGWWTSRSVEVLAEKIQRRKPAPRAVWEKELAKYGVPKEELLWLKLDEAQDPPPRALGKTMGNSSLDEVRQVVDWNNKKKAGAIQRGGNLSYEQVLKQAMLQDIGLETIVLDSTEKERSQAQAKYEDSLNIQAAMTEKMLNATREANRQGGGWAEVLTSISPEYMRQANQSGSNGDIKHLFEFIRLAATSRNGSMPVTAMAFGSGEAEVRRIFSGEKVDLAALARRVGDRSTKENLHIALELTNDWVEKYDPDNSLGIPSEEAVYSGFRWRQEAETAMEEAKLNKPQYTSFMIPGAKERAVNILTVIDSVSVPEGGIFIGHSFNQEERKTFGKSGQAGNENILAWVRASVREDAMSGEKFLFIEEIQSDWHQKVRKTRENKIFSNTINKLHRLYEDKHSDEYHDSGYDSYSSRGDYAEAVRNYSREEGDDKKITAQEFLQVPIVKTIGDLVEANSPLDRRATSPEVVASDVAEDLIGKFRTARSEEAKAIGKYYGYKGAPTDSQLPDAITERIRQNIGELASAEEALLRKLETRTDAVRDSGALNFYGAFTAKDTLEKYIESIDFLRPSFTSQKNERRLRVIDSYVALLRGEPVDSFFIDSPEYMNSSFKSSAAMRSSAYAIRSFYEIKKELHSISSKTKNIIDSLGDSVEITYSTVSENSANSYKLFSKNGNEYGSASVRGMSNEKHSASALAQAINDLETGIELSAPTGQPFAPWVDTWAEKALDNAIKYAVNNGIARIAVAKGEEAGAASGFPESGWVFYNKTIPGILKKKLGKENRSDVAPNAGGGNTSSLWQVEIERVNGLASGNLRTLSYGQSFNNIQALTEEEAGPQQALFMRVAATPVSYEAAFRAAEQIENTGFPEHVGDKALFMWDRRAAPSNMVTLLKASDVSEAQNLYKGETLMLADGTNPPRVTFHILNTQETMNYLNEQKDGAATATHVGYKISNQKISEYEKPRYKFLGDEKSTKRGSRGGFGFRSPQPKELEAINRAAELLPPVMSELVKHVGVMTGDRMRDHGGQWDRLGKQVSVTDWVVQEAVGGDQFQVTRTVAHEMFHALDMVRGIDRRGFTQNSPLLDIKPENISFNLDTGFAELRNAGPLMEEAFNEWVFSDQEDNIGLNYPFYSHMPIISEIMDRAQTGRATKAEIDKAALLTEEMKVEVGAQLFGMYYSNRQQVEKLMPATRLFMEKLDENLRNAATPSQAGRKLQQALWADTPGGVQATGQELAAASGESYLDRNASGRVERLPAGRQRPVLNNLFVTGDPMTTWEITPGAGSTESRIYTRLPAEQQKQFSEEAKSLVVASDGSDEIANRLGIPKPDVSTVETIGIYEGEKSPAFATSVNQSRPKSFEESVQYARTIQLVFKQQEVYVSQPDAGLLGAPDASLGMVLTGKNIDNDLLLEELTKKFPSGLGYTVFEEEVLLTNFFTDDQKFNDALKDIIDRKGVTIGITGHEAVGIKGDQGEKIRWDTRQGNDTRVRVEKRLESGRAGSQDLLRWTADRRQHFERLAKRYEKKVNRE